MFGLSFLNSGILFLAAATVIPLLIYLFAKKKPQRVIFSSIKFIKESLNQQKRRINIKNILLLIIRMLIILLIVLAISRPTIKADHLKKSTSHPKTAIAVIIDNSYSMDYLVDTRTELELALEKVRELNLILTENDIVIPLTLDENWNRAYGNLLYGKIPDDILETVTLTANAIPKKDIISKAIELLKEAQIPNQEIYLFSDLQRFEFSAKQEIPLFIIPTSQPEERSNISCQNATFFRNLVKKNGQQQLNFQVVNHSNLLQQDIICRLYLDGFTAAEKVTDLSANQTKLENFPLGELEAGWHKGYVEVKNERLQYDNRSYFSFYHEPNPKLAIITDLTELPITLDTMLEIYSGNPENLNLISSNEVNIDAFAQYDNIIVYKKLELDARLQFLLDKLQTSGKGVLFIADSSLNSDWQSYFADRFELKFEEFYEAKQNLKIDYANEYHPVTALFPTLRNIGINELWRTTGRDHVLLQSGKNPVALEKDSSLLWLFDIAGLKNPFLLDAGFPVFAYNSLVSSGKSTLQQQVKVGSKIKLKSNELTLPNGKELSLANGSFTVSQLGIYQSEGKQIPVNLSYDESNFNPLPELDKKDVYLLDEKWKDDILRSRYGIEIWKYLLFFVLLLFGLEMLLVKSIEKKS